MVDEGILYNWAVLRRANIDLTRNVEISLPTYSPSASESQEQLPFEASRQIQVTRTEYAPLMLLARVPAR